MQDRLNGKTYLLINGQRVRYRAITGPAKQVLTPNNQKTVTPQMGNSISRSSMESRCSDQGSKKAKAVTATLHKRGHFYFALTIKVSWLDRYVRNTYTVESSEVLLLPRAGAKSKRYPADID